MSVGNYKRNKIRREIFGTAIAFLWPLAFVAVAGLIYLAGIVAGDWGRAIAGIALFFGVAIAIGSQ